MIILPIVLLVLFIVFILGIWITVSLLGLVITLLVAALVGWVANKVVPGTIPYGWFGAIVAGLLGSWIGGVLIGDAGPDLGGIALIPAIVGAIILAFVLRWVETSQRPRS